MPLETYEIQKTQQEKKRKQSGEAKKEKLFFPIALFSLWGIKGDVAEHPQHS